MLDSPRPEISEAGAVAALKRRNPAAQRELLRRRPTLDDRWREIIREHHERMARVLRDAVLGSEPQMCINGCRAAVWLGDHELIPALANALGNEVDPNSDLGGQHALVAGRPALHRAGFAARSAAPLFGSLSASTWSPIWRSACSVTCGIAVREVVEAFCCWSTATTSPSSICSRIRTTPVTLSSWSCWPRAPAPASSACCWDVSTIPTRRWRC